MKRFFLLSLFYVISFISYAQAEVKEPDFIGESFILQSDNSPLKLEKETVQIKTRAGASVYIVGIGKVKSKIQIDGCCSNSRIGTKNDLNIVVRAVDNETDPLSIVHIFKFDSKRKKRLAELASAGTFSGGSNNNLEYVKFEGAKYGESSYNLSVSSIEPGEYGVIVTNPNSLDEKTTIVSTFGID